MRQTFCARLLWTESSAGTSALAVYAFEALRHLRRRIALCARVGSLSRRLRSQRRPTNHSSVEEVDKVELARCRQEAVVHLARTERECGASSSPRLSVTFSLVEKGADSDERCASQTSLRPFVFSPLALTSDPDSASHLTESQLRSLGSIQLRIYRGRVGEAADEGMNAGDADGGEGKGLGETKLWEESKKLGLSHQAS